MFLLVYSFYLSSLQDCEPTFDAYESEDDCKNEDEYASTSGLLIVLDYSTEQENLSSNGNTSVPLAEQSP